MRPPEDAPRCARRSRRIRSSQAVVRAGRYFRGRDPLFGGRSRIALSSVQRRFTFRQDILPTVLSIHGSISDVTDEELVLLARSGDRTAFGELVERYEVVVYRAALAALRFPEDAEEASQDAFVRAWRSLPQFRGDASFRTWLLTITGNRRLVRRRRTARWFGRRAPLEAASSVPIGDRLADRCCLRRGNEIASRAGNSPTDSKTARCAAVGEQWRVWVRRDCGHVEDSDRYGQVASL